MRWLLRRIEVLGFVLLLSGGVHAQDLFMRADSMNKTRQIINVGGQSVLTVSTLGALQFAWYQDYQNVGFHFFNDWKGWMQMDKVGHSATAYQISSYLYRINRWTGAKERPSLIWAAGMGYGYQMAVEVMDGFSDGWGFSLYDLGFNTIGTGAFIAQQLTWHQQPIKLKYSFWPSGLDQMNDFGTNFREVERAQSLFGKGLHEQWLKDYNGQTYWVSCNLWTLLGKPDRFPKWLSVSGGYSVNGVLGAESNLWAINDEGDAFYLSSEVRERQFLFSLDIDLDNVELPASLVWLRPIVGMIKFPFPALEFNSERGLVAHPIYF